MKKLTKMLLLVLVLALALVVTGCGKQEPAKAEDSGLEQLYWNLELEEYIGAGADYTSARLPRSDGLFYISFGTKGEKVELICADKAVVNKIDMQEVMGLEFDENGYIVGVKTVEECGYQLFSRMLYVTAIDGNVIRANNAASGKGVEFELTIDENTEIRNVSGGALMGYQPRELEVDDEIVVIKDNAGNVTHIFVKPIPAIGDVYWNTERLYNSTTQMTTREPDALGYYTYVFAIRGEQVTLRTRDMQVANAIDKQNAPVMTLEFDEEGLIIKKNSVTRATGGGSSIASWYDVIDINGNTVTAERKLSGTKFGDVVEFTMRNDVQIYDCTDFADVEGSVTELRVGDRIHGQLDARGRACIVFVVGNRVTGGVIGWNLDRKWDSTKSVSTRQPAEDGFYYIKMAIDGKPQTVKTSNRAYVEKIDSFVCYGMKLDENNNVKKVVAAQNIYGGGTYASYYYITKIENNVITAERDGKVQEIELHEDFICYDVSDHASVDGEVTTPKVGDRVHGFKLNGQLRELYVVSRPWDASLYWNINRQYNSTTKSTKRVPDEDGFYWFDFAVDGKQITLKTNEKAIADKIDSGSARHVALLHWNGWITKTIATSSITKYSGGSKSMSWVDVTAIDGNTIYTKKNQSGHKDDGKTFVGTMSKNCVVYNVDPDGVLKYVGEPTTVQVGDRIHVYHNTQGLITFIFVVDNRVAPLDTTPNTCPCENNVKWEPWDGTTELQNGKYYYLTQDVVAPQEGFSIGSMTVSLRLDGHTISSSGRCFWIKTDGKLNICDHDTRGKLIGTGVDGESGGVIRLYSGSGTVNLWNIDLLSDGDNTTAAKEGGICSVSGKLAAHNCTFTGGYTSDKGGIFQVSNAATLRLFDCTVTGGYAKNKGGNMNLSGRLYLENTTFSGGKSGGEGDNIYADSLLECVIKDSSFIAASGENNIYNSRAVIAIEGKVTITGGTGYNVKNATGYLVDQGMSTDSQIGVTRADAGVIMTNTTEEKLSCFTLENFKDQALVFVDGNIEVEERIILKDHSDHCLCAGNTIEGTSHSCSTVTDWKVISDDVFEDAIGTKGTSVGIKFIEDGNYYLSRDYELNQLLCIMPGQNITICLNGCELSSNTRISYVAGTLTFTDCGSTGKVIGNSSAGGNCIKTLNGSTLNIYGGTFEATKKTSSADGGVIVVSSDSGNVVDNSTKLTSTFNLYGGTIRGGKSIKDGGNVAIWHSTSVFNMYGGVIEDGIADELGGGLVTAGTVNLLGGTIRNNDVYCEAGTVTIGNKLKLEELTVKAGYKVKIAAQGLTAATPIKLNASLGVFATNVTSDLSACFQVADGYNVTYNAADMTLSLSGQAHKTHCLCNGEDLGLAPHTCKNISDWQPLTIDALTDYVGTNNKVVGKSVPSGNYYLPEDLTLSGFMLIVPAGRDITIDLCGHNITATSTRVSYVAGTLTFTDCEGGAKVSGNIAQNGGCIKVLNGGTLNIYGGTFTNPKKDTTGGAVVAVSNDAGNTVESSPKKMSTFNLYGGTLTGGQTSGSGGTVATWTSNTTFNMYGGIIENGVADKTGGSLSLNGPATILGGIIRGGSAAQGGNDVTLRNSAKLTLGGNVQIGDIQVASGKTFTIYDGGLTTAAPIIIDATGTFATGVLTDLSACFQALSGANIVYNEAEQTLTIE